MIPTINRYVAIEDSTPRIDTVIPGVPIAQPRTKAASWGGKPHIYTPRTGGIDQWKHDIRTAIAEYTRSDRWTIIGGCVEVIMFFKLPMPQAKQFKRKPLQAFCNTKPDIDNLAKAVLDALNHCGVWRDDSQVSILQVWKRYAIPPRGEWKGEQPGLRLLVYEVSEEIG